MPANTTRDTEIVTLCGSMRFFADMLDVAARLTADGCIVLAPFVTVAPADQQYANEFKARLDLLHRRKIDLSQRVVVVTDARGYIGESTSAEIAYASAHAKPIARAFHTPHGYMFEPLAH